MNIVAIDDERHALELLKEAVEKAAPSSRLACFYTGKDAVAYARRHSIDVAFIDVEMPEMSGLELAAKLKEQQAGVNIIFVTGYPQYAGDAFQLHASGYLTKPVRCEEVEYELKDLRYPVLFREKGIWIQTFGNFDVFAEGEPIHFRRSKSKEILAYLVDRGGATVTKKEIAAILWEDGEYSRNRQFQLQKLLAEMMRTLKAAHAEQIVRKRYNSFSVDPTKFTCDYYQFEQCDMQAVNAYRGEYMINYSWAEFTAGNIELKTQIKSGI